MSNRVEFDKEDIWRPQTPAHPSTEYFFCTVVQEHKNDGSNSNINSNISRQYLSLGCAVDFETDDIFIVYGIALPKDLSDGVFCNLHTFRTDRGYIRHEPCTLSLSNGNIDKLRVFNVDGERFRLRFFEWLSLESSLSDSL